MYVVQQETAGIARLI